MSFPVYYVAFLNFDTNSIQLLNRTFVSKDRLSVLLETAQRFVANENGPVHANECLITNTDSIQKEGYYLIEKDDTIQLYLNRIHIDKGWFVNSARYELTHVGQFSIVSYNSESEITIPSSTSSSLPKSTPLNDSKTHSYSNVLDELKQLYETSDNSFLKKPTPPTPPPPPPSLASDSNYPFLNPDSIYDSSVSSDSSLYSSESESDDEFLRLLDENF